MPKNLAAIRGMNDVLPKNSAIWQALEQIISELFCSYGYKNIRTPIVENTEVFSRAIGQSTDIIAKEMYSWTDTNNDLLSLRPEGTAGVVRAMIEHNLPREGLQKVFYFGAMFRHERPQKGRYRQFHQLGVEVFGTKNIKSEVELIAMTAALWQKLQLKNLTLEINTLGSEASRKKHKVALVEYFSDHKNSLDDNSLRQLSTNPLRILDSKNNDLEGIIQQAPKPLDFLDEQSLDNFNEFKNHLEHLKIPYQINPRLVRGLDYYNDVVFEWTTDELGSQSAVCAGGRYDDLVEKMGGKPTAGVGFAIGLERLILLLDAQNLALISPPLSIYLIAKGDGTAQKSLQIAEILHQKLPQAVVSNDLSGGSIKSQFKKADKLDADFALILGEDELKAEQVSIKPLKSQSPQKTLNLEQTINFFKEQI